MGHSHIQSNFQINTKFQLNDIYWAKLIDFIILEVHKNDGTKVRQTFFCQTKEFFHGKNTILRNLLFLSRQTLIFYETEAYRWTHCSINSLWIFNARLKSSSTVRAKRHFPNFWNDLPFQGDIGVYMIHLLDKKLNANETIDSLSHTINIDLRNSNINYEMQIYETKL